jgi:hypothetical protein
MPSPWDQFAPAPAASAADPWAQFKTADGQNQSRETALERIWAHPSNPGPLSTTDTVSAAVQRAGRGLIPGWNRVQAAMDATFPGGAAVPPKGETWGERYGESKANLDRLVGQFDREHPWASPAVGLAGSVPTMLATAGLSGPAALATPAGRIGEGARLGAGLGGMFAAGESNAQTVPQALLDMGGGMLAGGVAGAAVPAAMEVPGLAGRGAARLLSLKEAPAAAVLRKEGVPLTTGQRLGPDSFLAQMESASADNWAGLKPERDAAKQAFLRVTQNKGVAPGQPIPKTTDLQSRASEILKGFDPVYEQFKNVPIDPKVMASLPDAAHMPSRGIDARTAGAVKAEIENALTIVGFKAPASGHAHGHGAKPAAPESQGLVDQFGRSVPPPPKPPAAPPKATAGDLMQVRSYLRDEVSAARTAQDFPRLRLLRKAEEIVSEGIEGALPPDKASLLRDTDRQYARFLTSLEAAPAGQTEFTPLQYLKRVEKSAGRRGFKTGGAGDLQDLGEAARATFVDAPLTGFRGAMLGSIPFGNKLAAPASRWLNTPAAQRVIFNPGTSAPMSRAVPPEIAAMLQALQRRAIPLELAPAAADPDRSGR